MNARLHSLAGWQVMIVEDDYYLATDHQAALEAANATTVGPFPDKSAAARSLGEATPDFAFVDINLGVGPSFALPHALQARVIPFAFVTGTTPASSS